MILNLKLVKQKKGFCGPASLKIVMDFYGIEKSQDEWARLIGATKKSGCTPKQIISGLKNLKLNYIHKINSSIEELNDLIKNKTPPIIYWEPVKGYGHYSVLAGIDSKNVYIADSRKLKFIKMSLSEFMEKWHDEFGKKGDKREIIIITRLEKLYRKAVFAVVYRIHPRTKKPEYILLERKLHWSGWEFPKGGIDEGETAIETVKREVFEETGLVPINIKKYDVIGKYPYQKILNDRPEYAGQTYELFSAEVVDGYIKFDPREHSNFIWLSFEDAMKRLTWEDQKKCLRIVHKSLVK